MKPFKFCLFFLIFPLFIFAGTSSEKHQLFKRYERASTTPSDFYEHVPVLRQLATECATVVEIGMRGMVSSWGLLQGLAENPASNTSYLGIDINKPPSTTLQAANRLATANNIQFTFLQENDLNIQIPNTELLFIDSLHTYCHLTYELETFSSQVSKYIVLHDTSAPWGDKNEPYSGNYAEYPASINKTKEGLWPAVEDFLANHPEWTLFARKTNCHGLTILQRVSSN